MLVLVENANGSSSLVQHSLKLWTRPFCPGSPLDQDLFQICRFPIVKCLINPEHHIQESGVKDISIKITVEQL